MKKAILIALIVIAVPLYVWDVFLVVRIYTGSGKDVASSKPDTAKNAVGFSAGRFLTARYVKKGRSPFLAYKEKPKPKISSSQKRERKAEKPKKDVDAPKIVITGIMWNPQNPIAMVTLPDGSGTVAAAGKSLAGGIKVKKVEKNGIRIIFENREFWIAK